MAVEIRVCGSGTRYTKIRSSGARARSSTFAWSFAVIAPLSLKRRHSLSFGYSFTKKRPPLGWYFGFTSTAVRLTVTMRLAKSMSRGRSSVSSPHRMPLSMSVFTIKRAMSSGRQP